METINKERDMFTTEELAEEILDNLASNGFDVDSFRVIELAEKLAQTVIDEQADADDLRELCP